MDTGTIVLAVIAIAAFTCIAVSAILKGWVKADFSLSRIQIQAGNNASFKEDQDVDRRECEAEDKPIRE